MPSHKHRFVGSRGERVADDWDNEWGHRGQLRDTEATGGNDQEETEPHNNMPPYLVLNFCHKAASPG